MKEGGRRIKLEGDMTMEERSERCNVAGFEVGGRRLQAKECSGP